MKKFFTVLVLIIGISSVGIAQRYAYVDSQFILDQMPKYTEAQQKLNEYSEQWVKEIEAAFANVEQKRQQLQEEIILLPEEMKRTRQKEIKQLEQEAKELQKKRFGVGGDLFLKREELIKPLQDQIFEAIQQVAADRNYAFVFDKANQSNLLYADPKFDMSELVLRKMGIKIVNN